MDYEEAKNKFHMIAGTLISGQIFLEYSLFLKEMYNHKIKGDTTRLNRLTEAEAKVSRLVKYLKQDLVAIGCDLNVCQDEINRLESQFYDFLSLSEDEQKRIENLMTKIKKERNLKVA